MTRRRKVEEHENHERWLVSYADFITLLFAFFVVMYSVSSLSEGKYRALSNSISMAFGNPRASILPPIQVVAPISEQTLKNTVGIPGLERKQREKIRNIARDVTDILEPLVEAGKVKIQETNRGVLIEVSDSILFKPGSALLASDATDTLKSIAGVINRVDFPVIIEGHTDNTPISTSQFPTNWELSAVRATTVLRLFAETGISSSRLMAIGYGDQKPVDTNISAEGRARNRRVNLLIEPLRAD